MSCGTTPREVTLCVIGVPKGGGEPENIWRNNFKFSKFDKNYKPWIKKSQWKSSTRNMNETSPRKVYGCNFTVIKLLKTSDKRKIWKAAKEKETRYVQRNEDKNDSRLLIGKNSSQKTVVQLSLKYRM